MTPYRDSPPPPPEKRTPVRLSWIYRVWAVFLVMVAVLNVGIIAKDIVTEKYILIPLHAGSLLVAAVFARVFFIAARVFRDEERYS